MTAPIERIIVSAAVVCRDNCYLITRRLKGTHLEGLWEFPGGKCEPNETHEDCLRREIVEELGANIVVRERILSARHRYDTREVELHFFACDLAGDPHPRLGQEVRWVPRAELDRLDFPAADAELIDLLKAASSPSR